MQRNEARHDHISDIDPAENSDVQTIAKVNEVMRRELMKRSDFRRDLDDVPDRNGRIWRLFFPSSGKGAVVQYFNDDAPRDYKLDIPISVTKQLIEVVKAHEHVPSGDHKFDVAMYYDKPLMSIAVS